ncbi:dihydroxy-acid dehydratase [Citricoccus sp.]|uniref:dihydroxy-acid dehydratase n=1 Tax=Citricoccus sp. TaxID=1978372 RepID=UPI0028BDCEF3|nr:dihydroxy-acid dehydratase [Citricoccus sp.]
MELRSNFPVGSPRWATRRTQWKALGLSDEDVVKPKIAVVNSSSKLAPCFSHLDAIADQVVEAIREAGAVGFEIRTVAPTDFIMAAGGRGGYVLSSRDLLANDIEAAVEGGQLDGMICLASCDKTTPGQLMAAGRINVPTIVVPCGYQPCGILDNGEPADIEEVFLKAGHVATGGITIEDLCTISDRAIAGPGVCTGMGTANTMHIMAEALGMSLPGSAPVAANSTAMWENARASARIIVEAVLAQRRPRDILVPGAFRNAVAAVLAVSGSINSVKHLQAIAVESGVDVDISSLFAELGREVGPLTAIRPSGPDSIEDLEAAGGALGVLTQLEPVLDLEVTTIGGRTLGEVLQQAPEPDASIIRPLHEPRAAHATLQILYGSLAPAGSIVKLSATERRQDSFEGPAQVFEDAAAAIAAINAQQIESGSVLVLRGLGPSGTPGMGMASNVVFALNGAGLTSQVAVVTDGQLSGLVNQGIVVGEVKPEGALDGPLGLVHDGDRIRADIPAKTVDLLVPDEELERRRLIRPAREPARTEGWLGVYARTVTPLERGATLVPESAPALQHHHNAKDS